MKKLLLAPILSLLTINSAPAMQDLLTHLKNYPGVQSEVENVLGLTKAFLKEQVQSIQEEAELEKLRKQAKTALELLKNKAFANSEVAKEAVHRWEEALKKDHKKQNNDATQQQLIASAKALFYALTNAVSQPEIHSPQSKLSTTCLPSDK